MFRCATFLSSSSVQFCTGGLQPDRVDHADGASLKEECINGLWQHAKLGYPVFDTVNQAERWLYSWTTRPSLLWVNDDLTSETRSTSPSKLVDGLVLKDCPSRRIWICLKMSTCPFGSLARDLLRYVPNSLFIRASQWILKPKFESLLIFFILIFLQKKKIFVSRSLKFF